jgi:hypothetical protein
MARPWKSSLLPVLASIVLVAAASAQQTRRVANWLNLNQLAPGSEIRVTLTTGRILRGFLQRVTAELLEINATASQETVLRQDIRRVALKRAGHRGRNTLIGLAIGTGAGLAIGAVVDSRARPNGWFPNFGKAVFTPLGAIVGTVIGVALPTGGWRDVYRAP